MAGTVFRDSAGPVIEAMASLTAPIESGTKHLTPYRSAVILTGGVGDLGCPCRVGRWAGRVGSLSWPARRPRAFGTPFARGPRTMSLRPRLLLADDDRSVRLGVADLLEDLGLEFVHAETGSEALEWVEKVDSLQAALLDMHMPGATGLEVLPVLRQRFAGVSCIVYSGRWSPTMEAQVLELGATACLKKPVEPLRLRAEVKNILARLVRGSDLN